MYMCVMASTDPEQVLLIQINKFAYNSIKQPASMHPFRCRIHIKDQYEV